MLKPKFEPSQMVFHGDARNELAPRHGRVAAPYAAVTPGTASPNFSFVASNTLFCWPVARPPSGSVAMLVSRPRSPSHHSQDSTRLMALWPSTLSRSSRAPGAPPGGRPGLVGHHHPPPPPRVFVPTLAQITSPNSSAFVSAFDALSVIPDAGSSSNLIRCWLS